MVSPASGSVSPGSELESPSAMSGPSPLHYRWGNRGLEEQESKLAEVTTLGKVCDGNRTEELCGGDEPLSCSQWPPSWLSPPPSVSWTFVEPLHNLFSPLTLEWSFKAKCNHITSLWWVGIHADGLGAAPSVCQAPSWRPQPLSWKPTALPAECSHPLTLQLCRSFASNPLINITTMSYLLLPAMTLKIPRAWKVPGDLVLTCPSYLHSLIPHSYSNKPPLLLGRIISCGLCYKCTIPSKSS